MSYVTEAVIVVPCISDEVSAAITQPLPFDDRGQAFRPLRTESTGGSKWFGDDTIYAAALNYVSGEDLETWFRALPWGEYGADACLYWNTEGNHSGAVVLRGASSDY